nr:GNVR domain-containing protein [Pseudomonas sp. RW10S2]
MIEMFRFVCKQSFMIGGVSLAFGLAGLAYALLTTPEYRVSTSLRPAAINELDALNRTQIYELPTDKALIRVGAALDSYDVRLGYFLANPDLFGPFLHGGQTQEQAFEEFNQGSLNLVLPDARKKLDLLSAYIGLEMTYAKGVQGAEILNGFVKYAIDHEREEIAADLKVIVSNSLKELHEKLNASRAAYHANKESLIAELLEKDGLKQAQLVDELKALRGQLKARRADRIAQLDEAISIARSLGLKKPSTPSSMADASESGSNIIRTEVSNREVPLYFMGTDALEAERSVLRQRTSDDFTDPRVAQIGRELQLLKNNRTVEALKARENEDVFLKDIHELRAEINRLNKLDLNVERLNLVSIDQLASEPRKPVWPKKSLLVLSGLVLGGVIGVALALARFFVRRRQGVR